MCLTLKSPELTSPFLNLFASSFHFSSFPGLLVSFYVLDLVTISHLVCPVCISIACRATVFFSLFPLSLSLFLSFFSLSLSQTVMMSTDMILLQRPQLSKDIYSELAQRVFGELDSITSQAAIGVKLSFALCSS